MSFMVEDTIMEEIKNQNAAENEELVEAVAEIDTVVEKAEDAEAEIEFKYEITADGEMSGLTEAQRRRAEIFDKITTGILAFLLASPFLILLYILLWFLLKN